ncbi:MAG: glycosyltransferase, partial [Acidimicrobiales bacterium]
MIVAGAQVKDELADPPAVRPHAVLVTRRWGASSGEGAAAGRLFMGAVSLRADVSVVSLDDEVASLRYDGLFAVHPVKARSAADKIFELDPDLVVLSGAESFWLATALPDGLARSRVVALGTGGPGDVTGVRSLGEPARCLDAIVVFSAGEAERMGRALGEDRVHHVHLALPVNRGAAAAGMAGMTTFGHYVLVLSGFPQDDPVSGSCPPHEYLRQVLGGVSIAEVRHGRWLVTGQDRSHDVVWAPNRMNLWRLMAGADVTLDLRPPGPVGRECIESLLFGTPVVVPAHSAAAEHALAANAGLWYGEPGEMVDALRRLIEDADLGRAMSAAGRSWAEGVHGDGAAFVESALD